MADHRIINKNDIDKVVEYFNKGVALLRETEDKEYIEFFNKNNEIINNAEGAAADNNEKWTYLYSWVLQMANKLEFYLHEQHLLTKEVEDAYYALERMRDGGNLVQAYTDERRAAEDELASKLKFYHEQRMGLQVFVGILEGKTLEEAKEATEQREQAMMQAAAQGGLR